MFNWNDIRVEQEIAQERYRVIKQTYERIYAQNKKRDDSLMRDWFGNQLINLGCALKTNCKSI